MLAGHGRRCAVTCPDAPDWCLQDHIRPRLDGWRETPGTPGQFHAICPVHGGRKTSLYIRAGDRGRRIVSQCKAGCPAAAVRAALVRRGVPDGCLPRVPGQRTEDELAATIIAICAAVPPGRARELAIIAAVHGPLRSRAALATLGERFGIDRSTAYRVMDMSHGATNVTAMRWITPSHGATACRTVRQERDASTCGFGAIHHAGVDNSVGPEGLPARSVAVTPASVPRCSLCGDEIVGRRADADYCTRSCQQKAWRKAQAAAGAATPAGRAREPGRRGR